MTTDDADNSSEATSPGDGPDAARAALNRARAAARARGTAARGRQPGRRALDAVRRSGASPDARDPQSLARLVDGLVAERGWQTSLSVGAVLGRWSEIVGPDVAAHCSPEAFTDGVLSLRADSTAWATQVRLLSAALLRRLAEETGEGTVTKVVVRGPSAPSWKRGPRRAPGSVGPRDTYG